VKTSGRTFDFPISDTPCGKDQVIPIDSRVPVIKHVDIETMQRALDESTAGAIKGTIPRR
jgi:hypothetical protein